MNINTHFYFSVPTLIKKHARAEKLVEVNREGFRAITETANPADLVTWTAAAREAQAARYDKVEAMDYFGVTRYEGWVSKRLRRVVNLILFSSTRSCSGTF
jgi:hypothetical protein